MKIEIPNKGKEYVLMIFPDLKVLKRAINDISSIKEHFDQETIQNKCSYLNKKQVRTCIEVLMSYPDEDSKTLDDAYPVRHHIKGFQVYNSEIYKTLTSEILLQLSLKPNHFFGAKR